MVPRYGPTHIRVESTEHAAELLQEAETRFFGMLETCARFHPGAIPRGWLEDHEVELSTIVQTFDIPQF